MVPSYKWNPSLIQLGIILDQYNAPCHVSHVVEETDDKLAVELLPQPSYSSDLASEISVYFLQWRIVSEDKYLKT